MKKLTCYYFVLVLRNVNEDTPGIIDALYEAGCDDAMVGSRNGILSLDFDREAACLEDAIMSAIHDIENSTQAKVDHLEGSLVTLSEIAEKTGFTKQAISLFIKGQRGAGMFPVPFAGINSTSPIWRWSEVLQWLFVNKKITDETLIAEAKIIDDMNKYLQNRHEHADYAHV